MNSIESIIRQKLTAALQEQKKRVASSLFELSTPGTVGGPIGGPPAGTATGPANNNASKKQAKTDQIGMLRQKIALLVTQSAKSKDPAAMKMRLQIQNDKMKTAQDELKAIK